MSINKSLYKSLCTVRKEKTLVIKTLFGSGAEVAGEVRVGSVRGTTEGRWGCNGSRVKNTCTHPGRWPVEGSMEL